MKETFAQAGYKYLEYRGNRQHVLLNLDTNQKELFYSNKNHAGWGLVYKNTHLEFAATEL